MKTIKTRVILSGIFFSIFLASATAVAIAHRTDLRYYILIPFVLAYLFLPRRQFAGPEDDSQKANKINLWFSYLRVVYFSLALFVLLGLPRFI